MVARVATFLAVLRGGGALLGSPWPMEGHPKAGFGQDLFQGGWLWTHQSPKEDWPKGVQTQIGVHGNNRIYLVEDHVPKDWATAAPLGFNLLGKTVSYTVDMTKVPCGVVACLYFVQNLKADGSSNYCDIKSGGCFELDIMEANSVAWEVSTHTQTGKDFDGTCNEMGCSNNVGRYPFTNSGERTHKLYGPGAYIDTRMLFQVRADISTDGYLQVTLSQDGKRSLAVYNRTLAGNLPDLDEEDFHDWRGYPKQQGVPPEAAQKTVKAMEKGVRLVLSVWSTSDTHWLDQTGCSNLDPPERGTAAGSELKVYDLKIEPTVQDPCKPAGCEHEAFDVRAAAVATASGGRLTMAGAAACLLAVAAVAALASLGRGARWVRWLRRPTPRLLQHEDCKDSSSE